MKCFKRTVKANSDNRGTNISYAFGVPERNHAKAVWIFRSMSRGRVLLLVALRRVKI